MHFDSQEQQKHPASKDSKSKLSCMTRLRWAVQIPHLSRKNPDNDSALKGTAVMHYGRQSWRQWIQIGCLVHHPGCLSAQRSPLMIPSGKAYFSLFVAPQTDAGLYVGLGKACIFMPLEGDTVIITRSDSSTPPGPPICSYQPLSLYWTDHIPLHFNKQHKLILQQARSYAHRPFK